MNNFQLKLQLKYLLDIKLQLKHKKQFLKKKLA